MSIKNDIYRFVQFRKMVAETEKSDFYQDALRSAGAAMRRYWKEGACRAVLMLRECCEAHSSTELEFALRDAFVEVIPEPPMQSFHQCMVTALEEAGYSFEYAASSMDFNFNNVFYCDKSEEFFIQWEDPDDNSFDPPTYELSISPEEAANVAKYGYADGKISQYLDSVRKAIQPCIEEEKEQAALKERLKEQEDRQLYEQLKQRFEPEEAEEAFLDR